MLLSTFLFPSFENCPPEFLCLLVDISGWRLMASPVGRQLFIAWGLPPEGTPINRQRTIYDKQILQNLMAPDVTGHQRVDFLERKRPELRYGKIQLAQSDGLQRLDEIAGLSESS
jgi:hypothetical protein